MRKLIYILVLALIASIALNLWQWHTTPPPPATVTVHDTTWRDTTMHQPVAAETIRTSRVIKVKIPSPAHTDTLHDSILVQLPIEQRRYTDTLYTAWVSGYNPALDSIRIRQREITHTITRTLVNPAPRFAVGIQAGAGYGIITRRPDIFIGIGAQIRLW